MGIRYRKKELLEIDDLKKDGDLMSFEQIITALKHKLASMCVPDSVKEPLHALKDHSAGLSTIEFRGLPENWEVLLTLTGFQISPVISEMIKGAEDLEECGDALAMFEG